MDNDFSSAKSSTVSGRIAAATAVVVSVTGFIAALDALTAKTQPILCKRVWSELPWCEEKIPDTKHEDTLESWTKKLGGK